MSTVVNYLRYLRNISRKIGARSGLERALMDKSRRELALTIQREDFPQKITQRDGSFMHWGQMNAYLGANSDKQLFCGIGLCAGVRGDKMYASPILLVECDLEREEEGQQSSFNLSYRIDTISVNYDLLSSMIGGGDSSDDYFNPDLQTQETLIKFIESDLENFKRQCENEKSSNFLNQLLLLEQRIFVRFKDSNLNGLRDIQHTQIKYSFDFEYTAYQQRHRGQYPTSKSLFEGDLIHIPGVIHFFISNIPDQLSTYEALNNLINEVEQNGFGNKVLDKMFKGVFSDLPVPVNSEYIEELEEIFEKRIPLQLSENQRVGIRNAFESEVSYMQGPPGTGKSYTISALALAAIFLDKRVLIVSQKRPALRVVKEMIDPILATEEQHGIFYYGRDVRRELREHLAHLEGLANNQNSLAAKITRTKRLANELALKIRDLIAEKNRWSSNLAKNLDDAKCYTELNNEFIRSREYFIQSFDLINKGYCFKRIEHPEKYDRLLKILELIMRQPFKSRIGEIFKRKISKHIQQKFELPGFVNSCNSIEPLREFIKLSFLYTKADNARRLVGINNNDLRKCLEHSKKELENSQKELIKLVYKLRRLQLLTSEDHVNEIRKLKSMLINTNANLIARKMEAIDFGKVLDVLPLWAAEIRHLGHMFPLRQGLFDIVIVDEASQVNLAEIIPAFYRGGNVCIVGDHKQLNIGATGVNFSLSRKFDEMTWSQCMGRQEHTYSYGQERQLTVTSSSILDFIRSEHNGISHRQVLLDEHWRSLPGLASFTNTFYDNRLKVMTETANQINKKCFAVVKVDGQRDQDKRIFPEAEQIVLMIKKIMTSRADLVPDMILPDHLLEGKKTIGVVSMIRNQCELINYLLEESIPEGFLDDYNVMVGTPEEFQGHERDIMFISLCLDDTCTRGVGHYQNDNRFNVATSRAKYYTVFVYSEIPCQFDKIQRYVRHFGFVPEIKVENNKFLHQPVNPVTWGFNPINYESELERFVFEYIERYMKSRSFVQLRVFNQVKSCGQKRLDFVLMNEANKECVALEVDGQSHFMETGIYSEEHCSRIETLKKAGWKIVNTPYYCWYDGGWICDENNEILKREADRIYREFDKALVIG